jgi:hypothetical protein
LIVEHGLYLKPIEGKTQVPRRNISIACLHERYRKLLAKRKNKEVVMTAVGRELLGCIRSIGSKAKGTQNEPAAGAPSEFVLTSEAQKGSASRRAVYGKKTPQKVL